METLKEEMEKKGGVHALSIQVRQSPAWPSSMGNELVAMATTCLYTLIIVPHDAQLEPCSRPHSVFLGGGKVICSHLLYSGMSLLLILTLHMQCPSIVLFN